MFSDVSLPEISAADRPSYFSAMNATLAELHRVDFAGLGLRDYGRSSGYCARQLARWSTQYHQDTIAGRVVAMDRLVAWLKEHLPGQEQLALIHGDFRCDNLIFHPVEPRVLAVLDWELSTLGDPLADFAYHLLMYRMPTLAIAGLAGRDLKKLNIPSEEDYVAAYCSHTERRAIPAIEFYVAFNLFRLAAICHGIRGRVMRGNAVSARAREYAGIVEVVADLAWTGVTRAGLG
jgi:aminoglycoside phosphotransferase (APT) family kinase protein